MNADVGAETEQVTYTVTELATRINRVLRSGLGDQIWVRGEIQGYRVSGAHAYFTLADTTGPSPAVLNVQLFAQVRNRIRPMLETNRLVLADGIGVRICGQLDFWAQGGRLGLKMSDLDPRFTLGEIALARDAVIRDLTVAGLLDANARRPLALVPLRLGVVTSVGSAAWHDFISELERSGLGFAVTAVDARVQGEDAVPMVTAAINALSERTDIDAVLVMRGGGARNELATFDEREIAMAIAHCQHPVITGIGHEVDRSVADEVAHTALKTPTACAGFLVQRVQEYLGAIEDRWMRILLAAERALTVSTRVDATETELRNRSQRLLERAGMRLDTMEARIRSHDPAVMLARGWSITKGPDGRAVRSVEQLQPGDELATIVADGQIVSTVTAVRPAPHTPATHKEARDG
jgi:exodeoxyribonuclease VII large subunit